VIKNTHYKTHMIYFLWTNTLTIHIYTNNNVTVTIRSDIRILLVLHTITVSVQKHAYRKPVQSGTT